MQSNRTVTGLDPVQDVVCETLDLSEYLSVSGNLPETKKYLSYDPETHVTTYQDVDASIIDINSLPVLLSPGAQDELLIYNAVSNTNNKISPSDIDTVYQAGFGIAIGVGTNTISAKVDGTTLTNTTNGDELAVLKVPNVLSAGTNVTMSSSYDGSASVVISTADTVYTAASGMALSNQNQFSFSGSIGSTSITSSGDITLSEGTMKAQEIVIKDDEANESGKILFQDEYGSTQITLQTPNYNSIPSAYSITLPTSDGASGQLLTTQGSGILYWTTPPTIPTYTAGTALTLTGTQFNFNGNAGGVSLTCGELEVDTDATIHGYLTMGDEIDLDTNDIVNGGNIDAKTYTYRKYLPLTPPGYTDTSTTRKIQILPTQFVPNDDSSFYNLGLIDGSPNANTLYGFMKPMTSALECHTTVTIPEGYKIVSFKIFLRSTTSYSNVLRTCTAYKGNMSNSSSRYNLIYMGSSPYTNYEVAFTASASYTTFTEEEYLVLGVTTATNAEAIGGGWVKIMKS